VGVALKLDQFTKGQTFISEGVFITKEQILEFARQYDPQYFHIDEEAAKESHFGQLIASGFHSIGAVWAEFIRMDVLGRDCRGGLGIDDMRWKVPVYANDTLYGEFEVKDKQLLSDEKKGILFLSITVTNQSEQLVASCVTKILMDKS
jgi:acyl dehydratase